MKLLIVNDEIITADTMKTDIDWKRYGITDVRVAYNAEEGKKALTEQEADILLLDIEMPGENGIGLLRWVRERQMDAECIFLTCHASFEYAKEAMYLGCRDYLLVPAKYEEIGSTVLRVAERIRKRREEKQYQEYGRQAVREQVDKAVQTYGEKWTPEETVQEAVDLIRQNLGSGWLSVEEVANRLYVHPVYLNRIFRREKETSVRQFIMAERMKLAGELLKSGKLSANAVAEQVGYQSYSNFYLMFRGYYNCTPAQYQAEHSAGK